MKGSFNKKRCLTLLTMLVLLTTHFLSAGVPVYAAGTVYKVSSTAVTSGTDINWADLPTQLTNGGIASGDTIEFLDVPPAELKLHISNNLTLDGTALAGAAIPLYIVGMGAPNITLRNISLNSGNHVAINCLVPSTLIIEGNVYINSNNTAIWAILNCTIGGTGTLELSTVSYATIFGNATLKLIDDVTVNAFSNDPTGLYHGIICDNLVMEDNSSLSAYASNNASATGAAGLYISDNITHNSSGSIQAFGGSGVDGGNGISCHSLVITGTGNIKAVGNNSGLMGSGIYAGGTIEHLGSGIFEAVGGFAINSASPVKLEGEGEIKINNLVNFAVPTTFSSGSIGAWDVTPSSSLDPAYNLTDSQITVTSPQNIETVLKRLNYSASISTQSGTLTEGTAGTATYQLTTQNIPSGTAIGINNVNGIAGISLSAASTTGNNTAVTIQTSAATPAGSHPLTLDVAGVQTDTFYLTVSANSPGTINPPAPPASTRSSDYDDYDFSNLRAAAPVVTEKAPQPKVITTEEMSAAIKYAYTYAQGATTAPADLWKLFAGTGRGYRHDTFENCKVQVRVQFENPEKLNKDLKLGGYVSGTNVQNTKNIFAKYYSNSINVIVFDQQEDWGQTAHIAANISFATTPDNLYFYSYNCQTNTYKSIATPAYYIDGHGYLRFDTPFAGTIIISDGPLKTK